MNIFNYGGMAFARHNGENFDVLTMSYLDYNNTIQEITVTWSAVGRKSIWLAQFSGLTTEYSGELEHVLSKCLAHYEQHRVENAKK